jgi:RND family efflux transporter MFP subunit
VTIPAAGAPDQRPPFRQELPMSLSPSRSALSAAALLFAALALAGCKEAAKSEVAPPADRPVKTVTLAATAGTVSRSYSGAVRARMESALSFRVGGKIVARLVDVGDHVDKDTLIARIDATDLKLSLDAATANVEAARIRRDVAADELARIQSLNQKGFAAKSALDTATGNAEAAASAYQVAVAQRDQAVNQTGYTELKADASGIVTDIRADVGQVVAAGTPIVTVARDGEKEIAFAVPEQTVTRLAKGDKVRVSAWADQSLKLSGTIREIAGAADAASRTFAVRVALPAEASDNPRLRLGMTASVEIDLPAAEDSLVVPMSALAKNGNDPIVWVFDRATSTVSARPVAPGPGAPEGVRILSGLAPGDVVIVAGTQFMRDGLKVRPLDGDLAALTPAPSRP